VSYLAKQKEIQLNRRCERLVVYSRYQKEELIRNGFEPAKIEVHVPMHGADSTEEHADTRGARNRVLFVGQVIRGKGVDLLLRALAKVRVPFEARILGDGSHRATCERLSKRLGLADRVRFDGFVPREALASEYAEASLLAVSSVWPEPFGLVGQEAMLHGLPIVGFDAGGIREWLLDGENGFLVPWADTDQFARRIEQLLSDRQLARRLGDQGRNMITRQRAAFELDCPLEQMFARVLRENRTSYQINNTFHSDPQPACV
jgi:glycosyltransferase involved in cell wall biosynthesis